MNPIIASFESILAGAFPLALVLTGATLHFFAPHHRAIVEERVREHDLTESAARRRVRFVRWSALALTLLGVVLTVFLLVDLFL